MSEFEKKKRGNLHSASSTSTAQDSSASGMASYVEKVVHVNRCANVVKGGRRFSFAALVVCSKGKGNICVGYSKAKEVPDAIRKATEQAHKNSFFIELEGTTIPHPVTGKSDGSLVVLRPACLGTGVRAGGAVREVLKVLGVTDILSKSLKSGNPISLVNATVNALRSLRSKSKIKAIRCDV